jgi:capsid protein
MIPLGYYDRFDQVRGISPLTSAINKIQDLEESIDAVLIKEKMHAMLGIAITRDVQGANDGWANTDRTTGNTAGSGTANNDYDFEIRNGMKLEMNPGDRIDVIESKTPSNESQSFMALMIQIAMLAVDIPVSFFDSRKSSYIAKRADILDYQNSIRHKQEGMIQLLNTWTEWKLRSFIDQDLIEPIKDINLYKWEWIPRGAPVLDSQRENAADLQAISGGLTSPQRVAKERGVDAMEILDEIAEYQSAARSKEVQIQLGDPGSNFLGIVNGQVIGDLAPADGDEDTDTEDDDNE